MFVYHARFASFRYCFFSLAFGNITECEDSFNYALFDYFTDSLFFKAGFQARMIITLDIFTSFALLGVSMLSFGLATYHLFAYASQLP